MVDTGRSRLNYKLHVSNRCGLAVLASYSGNTLQQLARARVASLLRLASQHGVTAINCIAVQRRIRSEGGRRASDADTGTIALRRMHLLINSTPLLSVQLKCIV